MKVKTWRCETAPCPVRHLVLGHVESETLENLLAAVRCLYCWQPLTLVLPSLSPPPVDSGQ